MPFATTSRRFSIRSQCHAHCPRLQHGGRRCADYGGGPHWHHGGRHRAVRRGAPCGHHRRERLPPRLARKMGASRAINVSRESIDATMKELGMQEGFDIGLEMSGNAAAFRECSERCITKAASQFSAFHPARPPSTGTKSSSRGSPEGHLRARNVRDLVQDVEPSAERAQHRPDHHASFWRAGVREGISDDGVWAIGEGDSRLGVALRAEAHDRRAAQSEGASSAAGDRGLFLLSRAKAVRVNPIRHRHRFSRATSLAIGSSFCAACSRCLVLSSMLNSPLIIFTRTCSASCCARKKDSALHTEGSTYRASRAPPQTSPHPRRTQDDRPARASPHRPPSRHAPAQ